MKERGRYTDHAPVKSITSVISGKSESEPRSSKTSRRHGKRRLTTMDTPGEPSRQRDESLFLHFLSRASRVGSEPRRSGHRQTICHPDIFEKSAYLRPVGPVQKQVTEVSTSNKVLLCRYSSYDCWVVLQATSPSPQGLHRKKQDGEAQTIGVCRAAVILF